MQLQRLSLAQFRVFEQATFSFRPGINLLIGINGVGKSSMLDTLRVLLSQALPKFTASRSRVDSFGIDDITVGRDGLTAELDFESGGFSFSQLMREQREEHIPVREREGQVRGQTYDSAEHNRFTVKEKNLPKDIKTATEQPLAVYFSTHRLLPIMKAPSKRTSAGGQAARGEIHGRQADDQAAKMTIEKIRLDHRELVAFRKAAIQGTLGKSNNLSLKDARRQLNSLRSHQEGQREPFCFVLVQALQKHIGRLEAIAKTNRRRA